MICLLIPYYRDKKKARRKEIDLCLQKNLSNSAIDLVVAVCDQPLTVKPNKKLSIINIGRRQKYKDFFELGSAINPDGINILSNADIYFKKEDILQISKIDYTDTVLALSRWDVHKNGPATHHNHKDSQDTWIWKGKINAYGDFELGRAGCDNVIAYELAKNYNVVNPSNTIKTYHVHSSNIRNYTPKDAYPPPYLRVPCCYYNPNPIKRVLHVGLNPSGQSKLGNALKSLGEYRYFDWRKIKDKYGVIGMRERLVDINNKMNPDLVFMQIQTPNVIDQETASLLKGVVVNWTGDVREDISWFKNLAPFVDWTCFTNETDTTVMREESLASWFYQIGFENHIFKPDGTKLADKRTIWNAPDIVFMANHYGDKFPLSQERYSIASRLYHTFKDKFLLCGRGWNIPAVDLVNRMQDEAMVYRSCKIAINANHFIHKRFSSDRIFRIMGSGAFCLTRWYPGIEKDFIDGIHLKTFKNEDELIYLINYYLKNETERIEIAEQGCAHVHENFTWDKNKLKQMHSFPQMKQSYEPPKEGEPMSTKEWMEYLKS